MKSSKKTRVLENEWTIGRGIAVGLKWLAIMGMVITLFAFLQFLMKFEAGYYDREYMPNVRENTPLIDSCASGAIPSMKNGIMSCVVEPAYCDPGDRLIRDGDDYKCVTEEEFFASTVITVDGDARRQEE